MESTVKFIPLNSSMFDAVAYNDAHNVLTLKFKNGLVKAYQQVPEEVYAEFMAARSQGTFFNSQIKGKYESLVVAEAVKKPLKVDDKPVAADADLSQVIQEAPPIPKEIFEFPQKLQEATEALTGAQVLAENSKVHLSELGYISECYVHMDNTPHWKRPDGSLVCSLCHPQDAKEPTGSEKSTAALLLVVPEVLAPLEPPKTAVEAVKMLTEQAGMIQATINKSNEIATEAMAVRVTDAKTYTDAGERLKFLAECQDRAVNFLDPIRVCLLKPYQQAQQLLKAAAGPFDIAKQHVSTQRRVWADEQERLRQAEQDRLRREEEAKAEEERKARSEQLTLGAVDEALASGDTETAEKLISEPIQVPGEYIPPVHVESVVPKTKGISGRKNWKAEVTSIEDLVISVAEGIVSLKQGKGLQGHAPLTFIEINQTAINQAAKSQEKAMSYPGLKAFNDAVESVRRKK